MAKAVLQTRVLTFLTLILGAAPQLCAQSSDTEPKRATVLLQGIKLEEAIMIIGISYGVQFSYSDNIVPIQSVIDLNLQNEVLHDALTKVLQPFGITFRITDDHRVVLFKKRDVLTQTVRGVITDAASHSPIPGVTVVVINSFPLLATSTNEKGEFKIEQVPVGRFAITSTSIGYDPKSLFGLLTGSGKELVLDFQMQESITNIKEVVITAPGNESIPGDGLAITSGHSFSIEESKRYAGSLGDPARMASGYAGVTSGSDDSNALVVRGNSPRGVLWRIEGIELPNPNHFATEGASSGVISMISPNIIARTDFLSGAFPAQYGNALSAVLDITMRNGNSERREYSIQAGLTGLEASTEGPISKRHSSSYLVNYRYSTLSVLDNLGLSLSDLGQYKNYQDLSFKVAGKLGKTGTIALFGIGGKSQSSQSDTTLSARHSSDMGIAGLTYKNQVNEKMFIQAAISYSGTLMTSFRKANEVSSGTFFANEHYAKSYLRTSVLLRRKFSNRYFTEGGVIVSNLNYNFFLETIDPNNSTYPVVVSFSKADNNRSFITQTYIQSRQYFSPRLSGYYGVHLLSFSLSNDYSFEPRAGLRWQFSPVSNISIAYGKHSRIENLQYYLARDHQTGGHEIQVNRNLRFTRAHHSVISFEHALSAYHELKVEGYYQKLYNSPVQTDPTTAYASINQDTGFVTDSLINSGKGTNYGIELSLDRVFNRNYYYQINGSVFQSQFGIGGGQMRNTAYNGNYSIHILGGKEFEVKQNRIGINLKITQAGGRRYVPIDLTKSIEQKTEVHDWNDAFKNKLPPYFRTDIQLVYKLNRHRYSYEFHLDIQNATNYRNAAWYYYDKSSSSIKLKRQPGIIPLLSCRFEF